MQIYPSILETDIGEFKKSLRHFRGFFKKIQIDITDGIFVPNLTIQPSDISRIFTEDREMLRDYEIEFHLMVDDILDYWVKLEKLEGLDITDILVHVKSEMFESQINKLAKEADSKNIKIGLVFNPYDSVSNWKKYIWDVDLIQIMTVIPGRQGNPFVPSALNKIDDLREMGWGGQILLDGGINEKSLGLIQMRKYQPDSVCPGSWLKDMEKSKLKNLFG